jgi:aminoglycoside 6'-N-acetyltransferase
MWIRKGARGLLIQALGQPGRALSLWSIAPARGAWPEHMSADDTVSDEHIQRKFRVSADGVEGWGELVLRPLAAGDERELLRIHGTPEVMRWWDLPDDAFPWDEPESTRLTIEVDGTVAGLIQFSEELEPKYRHAEIDLFLDPALHGRGVGTAAVRCVVGHLVDERGHHRITIDPAVDNSAAVRAYEKAGFRPVGVMRRSERDVGGGGWHDSLLMEFLAGEDAEGPSAA